MLTLTFVAHEVHRRGGQERAAAEVLTRLARDHDVRVSVVARSCELPGVDVRFVPVRVPARPAILRTMMFARAAAAAARREGSQLVQSIGAAAPEADIITAQFCQAAFTARYGGLRGGGGSAWRAAWQRTVQRGFVAAERRAYGASRLRRVIAVSSGVARELREHYRVPEDVIRVIPNGVDHAVFHPVSDAERRALRLRFRLPVDACIALFLGGDWERKGLRDAIEAVAGVSDVVLVVVGRGDEGAMRTHATRLGAAGQVTFAGPSAEPQLWYQAADFLLFPSRYEAFSLVTLEAAATGLPIIAHAINGTEDLILPRENGILSEWGSEALRSHVVTLRDDLALRERMRKGAVVISRRYAWHEIAAAHHAVLVEAARG
jgi:UDP-glucose:(heptosyl)LPS alpha-1,3-glucosyltransferase